jgi:hypothetical protein
MKLHRFALALCLGVSIATGCTLYDDTGTPDPGVYWSWVCPETGDPAPEAGCGPRDASREEACADGKVDGACR